MTKRRKAAMIFQFDNLYFKLFEQSVSMALFSLKRLLSSLYVDYGSSVNWSNSTPTRSQKPLKPENYQVPINRPTFSIRFAAGSPPICHLLPPTFLESIPYNAIHSTPPKHRIFTKALPLLPSSRGFSRIQEPSMVLHRFNLTIFTRCLFLQM